MIPEATSKIRIVIAEDHCIFRQALQALLAKEADIDVIKSVAMGKEAVAVAVRLRPDVLLMDIGLPDLDGIQATREVVRRLPHCRVLCFSMHYSTACVRAALEAGASGYLLKQAASDELFDAIRRVAAGERYVSDSLVENAEKAFRTRGDTADSKGGLFECDTGEDG